MNLEIFKNFNFCTYLALNRGKFNNYLTQSLFSAGETVHTIGIERDFIHSIYEYG